MTQRTVSFPLMGGLDLVTPAAAMPPGHLIGTVNYEGDPAGYARVGGYERLDGRPAPHEGQYWTLFFENARGAPVVGDPVTVPGGSATLLADPVIESGGLTEGNNVVFGADEVVFGADPVVFGPAALPATGYLPLTDVSGDFAPEDAIEIDSVPFGDATSAALESGAPDSDADVLYRTAAMEARRALIEEVPGSGPVRGAAVYGGTIYAIRDNAGATAGVFHRSTPTGWEALAPNPIVTFTAGADRFVQGETLTQGGVTATIEREVTTDGSYDLDDATGYLVLSGVTGGSFSAGAATSASGAATLDGAETIPTIPAGGRYEAERRNFRGALYPERLYWSGGGVGRAFEWDRVDEVLAQIRAIDDEAIDKPTHVSHFQNHLVLSYDGGAMLISGIGEPLDFRAIAGAAEFSFGESPSGFATSDTALIVTGETRISYLTGTSAADFQLLELAEDSGAAPWTVQTIIGKPMYLDAIGVRDLTASEQFGGWRRGTQTMLVEPLFKNKARRKVRPAASLRVRGRDQYRLYWDDKTGVTVYFGRQNPETIPFELPIQITCTADGIDIDGRDILVAGAEDGFVYHLDVGPSFDGDEIESLARLAYFAAGDLTRNKRWISVRLDVDGGGETSLMGAAEFDYGNPDAVVGQEETFRISSGGGVWNDTLVWDEFYWSAHEKGRARMPLDGFGPAVSVAVMSKTGTEPKRIILSSAVFNLSMRGVVKA